MKTLKYSVLLALVTLIHVAAHSQPIIFNSSIAEKYRFLPISEFTIAEADTSEFSIAGIEKKNAITAFFYVEGPQKIYTSVKDETRKFKKLCMCNASVVNIDTARYVYTAKHCAKDIPFSMENIGHDGVLIKSSTIVPNDSIPSGYVIGTMEDPVDSLFILGFIQRKLETMEYYEGKLISYQKKKIRFKISISGLAEMDNTKTVAFMQLDDIYDLHGLSGSPVFNSKGQVVGVCSKHMYKTKKGVMLYSFVIVSLFKK